MTLPVSDHVVAVTEALFAEIANKGSVAVLERGPRTRRLHGPFGSAVEQYATTAAHHDTTAAANHASSAPLRHGHTLLVFPEPA
jgi:hypothetical protein